jgi:hypothetical protein
VFQQELERFPNVAVRLVVGIQVVLQLIDQAGERSELVVNFNARVLGFRTHHRLMDSGRSLLDECDEELYAVVWLIGDIADLLFLIRGERILGALGVRRERG